MFTTESVCAALRQEGYLPGPAEGGALTFRYYGQDGQFRVKRVGGVSIGELECRLPRPAPTPALTQSFETAHPLSRLSGVDGQAVLTLETLLTEHDVPGQVRLMLRLLDAYAADVVFGGWTAEPQVETPRSQEPLAPSPVVEPAQVGAPPVAAGASPEEVGPPAQTTGEPAQIPTGWEALWPLMSARYHPLARALADLQVPAPDEVQMDMMQGRQVRGTAIMMWGAPPNAVVVCEPGQPVPQGYQGSTWLKHLTVERVAQETRAHLQAAGRL
ncbi:hypothetical protein [Deinococcus aestuarii]|uniref:hypothetical protein n=1 Tax=Deinococcus aestuarii TaxID=2774531 RepID=UPI001C0B4616|nr:hypothetical protein [Deinococcus aestuarii]